MCMLNGREFELIFVSVRWLSIVSTVLGGGEDPGRI